MGGGGLRASRPAKEPRTLLTGSSGGVSASSGKPRPLPPRLQPALHAANSWPRGGADSDLDRLLQCLALDALEETSARFADWLPAAAPRARAGLAGQLQRLLRRELAAIAAAAEATTAEANSASDSCPEVSRLAATIEEVSRPPLPAGVSAAVSVLDLVARHSLGEGGQGAVADFIVPALDSLVRVFHRSLVTHVRSSWRNLQRWREMEAELRLPPLEDRLHLLGCTAKGLLMSMLLVPEGVPQASIVVARESALSDVQTQLPEDQKAAVLSPYFESSAGSKVMHGRRVEGGEGHGPRKEFFIHASAAALRRWSAPAAAPDGNGVAAVAAEADSTPQDAAVCKGQRIKLSEPSQRLAHSGFSEVCDCLDRASAGDSVRLELADGSEVERLITSSLSALVLVVDKCFDGPAATEPVVVRYCELRKPVWPLFDFHRSTGQQWFAAHANELTGSRGEELRASYRAFGKLLGLAVANHCKLSFVLPALFFRLLLRRSTASACGQIATSLDDLRGFDDVLHAALTRCLKMRQGQFRTLKQVEGLSASCTREEYVRDQLKSILAPEALTEIRQGFASIVREEHVAKMSSDDLRHWVCPVSSLGKDINLRHVFNVVMEEEMSECPPLVEAFWETLDGLTEAEKKLFLLFVTGVEDPPELGTEQLIVQLPFSAFTTQEHVAMLGMLPQAHTCTNTLELPNYYDALKESGTVDEDEDDEARLAKELRRVLGDRLRTAISETGGYELDAVECSSEREEASPSAARTPAARTPVARTPAAHTPEPAMRTSAARTPAARSPEPVAAAGLSEPTSSLARPPSAPSACAGPAAAWSPSTQEADASGQSAGAALACAEASPGRAGTPATTTPSQVESTPGPRDGPCGSEGGHDERQPASLSGRSEQPQAGQTPVTVVEQPSASEEEEEEEEEEQMPLRKAEQMPVREMEDDTVSVEEVVAHDEPTPQKGGQEFSEVPTGSPKVVAGSKLPPLSNKPDLPQPRPDSPSGMCSSSPSVVGGGLAWPAPAGSDPATSPGRGAATEEPPERRATSSSHHGDKDVDSLLKELEDLG